MKKLVGMIILVGLLAGFGMFSGKFDKKFVERIDKDNPSVEEVKTLT
ncbi:MAG: hypothetical protein ACOWYE_18470 [Desulfatiglandales bacterium]